MWSSFMEWWPTWTAEDDKKWDVMTAHNQKNLDSETIDPKYPYAKQADVIRWALQEAFDEYSKDIRLTNSFLFALDTFMDRMQTVKNYKWPHEGSEYEAVIEGGLTGGNNIIFGVIDYGKPAIDKMKADLVKQWKTPEEITKIVKWKFDKFLTLLRERIAYEP